MLKEFREFAVKGNMLDMAVGVIIGGAFGKIVTSLVNDVLMPPIGLLVGKVDFSNLFVNLGDQKYDSLKAAKDAGAPTLNLGIFMNAMLDFLIVAFVVFLLVRQFNRVREKLAATAPPPPPNTRDCPFCLGNIPLKATRCGHCTSELKA